MSSRRSPSALDWDRIRRPAHHLAHQARWGPVRRGACTRVPQPADLTTDLRGRFVDPDHRVDRGSGAMHQSRWRACAGGQKV